MCFAPFNLRQGPSGGVPEAAQSDESIVFKTKTPYFRVDKGHTTRKLSGPRARPFRRARGEGSLTSPFATAFGKSSQLEGAVSG
jgi:hypothetical protein